MSGTCFKREERKREKREEEAEERGREQGRREKEKRKTVGGGEWGKKEAQSWPHFIMFDI